MKLTNNIELEKIERLPTPVPFPPGHINSYLIQGEEPILIDTGIKSEKSWDALAAELKKHGLAITDVRHLLITHAHIDHFGQAKRIQEESGCKLYACRYEVPRLRKLMWRVATPESPFMHYFREWGVPEQMIATNLQSQRMSETLLDPVEVDVAWDDGQVVEIAGVPIRGVWVPGHAIGHMVFIVDQWQVMFSADHLLPDISPVPLLNFPDPTQRQKTRSLVEWLESLEKVEREKLVVALPSHGDPILDHRELIASYRLHFRKRRLKVERILRDKGPMTAWELAQEMFGEQRAIKLLYLTLSEAVGYLEVLADEHRLYVEPREGVHYYQLDPEADPWA